MGLVLPPAPHAILRSPLISALPGFSSGSLAPIAPAVMQVSSEVGDSWTDCNQQQISRDGSTIVPTDRWTNQLASTLTALLGTPFTEYTSPTQPGVTANGIIKTGYGGQTSGTVWQNMQAVIAGEAARANNAWLWGPGRNDVSNPGGDKWPSVTYGTYSTTCTGTSSSGSTSVTGTSLNWGAGSAGDHTGMSISGPGVPAGAYITASSGTTITLSAAAGAGFGAGTFTITSKGATAFLSSITHERKMVWIPYGGGSVSSGNSDWVRWNKLKWLYRRNIRQYLFEFTNYFMSGFPNGAASGNATDLDDVINQAIPTTENFAAHPNYLAAPPMAAEAALLTKALLNKGVYCPAQTIPDVPYDLAAGQTLTVYTKGYATAASLAVDDPTLPACFTVSLGSSSTVTLTRTSTSPGNISRTLNLSIKVDGVNDAGGAVTHTGIVRILPSMVGATTFTPQGCTFVRDTVSTGNKRFPRAVSTTAPYANGSAFTIVFCLKPNEDGTVQHIFINDGNTVLIERWSNNRFAVVVKDSAGTSAISWIGSTLTTDYNTAGGATWFAFSINLSGNLVTCYSGRSASDVNIAAGVVGANNGTIDLASSTPALFAASSTGASSFKGGLMSLWVADAYVDFSNSANRRAFWNTNGTPALTTTTGIVNAITPKIWMPFTPGDGVTMKNFGSAGDIFGGYDSWMGNQGQSADPLPF